VTAVAPGPAHAEPAGKAIKAGGIARAARAAFAAFCTVAAVAAIAGGTALSSDPLMRRAPLNRYKTHFRRAVRPEEYRAANGLSAVAAPAAVAAVAASAAVAAVAAPAAVAAGTVWCAVNPGAGILAWLAILTLLAILTVTPVLTPTARTGVAGERMAVLDKNIVQYRAAVSIEVHRSTIHRSAVSAPQAIRAAIIVHVNTRINYIPRIPVRIRRPYPRTGRVPIRTPVVAVSAILTIHTPDAAYCRVRIADIRTVLKLKTQIPRLKT